MDQTQAVQPAPTPAPNAPMTPSASAAPAMGEAPKKSGWLKWTIIILLILIVVGGAGYWILAP